MCRIIRYLSLSTLFFTLSAFAADFGGHIGYFDNDVKKAYIGADVMLPIGPIVIAPNIDYWKEHGVGYWIGNGDVALQFKQAGGTFWVGAGPAYGYLTNYHYTATGTGRVHSLQYSGGGNNPEEGFGNDSDTAWGWSATGGFAFGGRFRPYVTGRYDKIKSLKAGGAAVGIRF